MPCKLEFCLASPPVIKSFTIYVKNSQGIQNAMIIFEMVRVLLMSAMFKLKLTRYVTHKLHIFSTKITLDNIKWFFTIPQTYQTIECHLVVYGCIFLPSSHNDMHIITTMLLNALLFHCAQYFEIFGMQYRNVCTWSLYHLNVKKTYRIFSEHIFSKKSNKNNFTSWSFTCTYSKRYTPYNQNRNAFCYYMYDAFITSN